jgi:hypothetical protein
LKKRTKLSSEFILLSVKISLRAALFYDVSLAGTGTDASQGLKPKSIASLNGMSKLMP